MPRDSDSVNSDNDRIPKSTYEIYRAEADSLLRNSEFVKAAKSYTKALELKPGDKHCLVSRSICYLRVDMTEEALRDVEESVKEDRLYYKGILQKAEVLYFQGDFERALVYYHRGNKLRPELEDFRLGIQKAEEAINNSVGDSSIELTCDGDLSYFYQHQEKAKKPRGGYSKQKQVQEKKKVERKKSTMDSKTQKKLLGQLYNDVTFLNHMIRDEKHTAHKTQNSEEINTLAIEALNFLESRTEFWQQQSPARSSKSAKKDTDKDRNGMQPARYVLTSLEEIDKKQTEGQAESALRQARQVMKHVTAWTEKDLSNKQEVLANLYSVIGNCFLDLGNVNKALANHEKDLQIGKEHNIQDSVSRAMDNLGRCHAKKGDYREAINIWNEKLPTSQSELESAWLRHEIGRCHLELHEYEKAKEYGEESLRNAEAIEDNSWLLNASVLVAQAEVKLKDYQAAIDTFGRALDYAELCDNKKAQEAVKNAMNEVNREIVREENEREQAEAKHENQSNEGSRPVSPRGEGEEDEETAKKSEDAEGSGAEPEEKDDAEEKERLEREEREKKEKEEQEKKEKEEQEKKEKEEQEKREKEEQERKEKEEAEKKAAEEEEAEEVAEADESAKPDAEKETAE